MVLLIPGTSAMGLGGELGSLGSEVMGVLRFPDSVLQVIVVQDRDKGRELIHDGRNPPRHHPTGWVRFGSASGARGQLRRTSLARGPRRSVHEQSCRVESREDDAAVDEVTPTPIVVGEQSVQPCGLFQEVDTPNSGGHDSASRLGVQPGGSGAQLVLKPCQLPRRGQAGGCRAMCISRFSSPGMVFSAGIATRISPRRSRHAGCSRSSTIRMNS